MGAWLICFNGLGASNRSSSNTGTLIAWRDVVVTTGTRGLFINISTWLIKVYNNKVGCYNVFKVLGYRSDSPYISTFKVYDNRVRSYSPYISTSYSYTKSI